MFVAFIFLMFLSEIEVFGSGAGIKSSTDKPPEIFHVSPFHLENATNIRLNISIVDGVDCSSLNEISVTSDEMDDECHFLVSYHILDCGSVVIPAANITDPMDNILPGCMYTISLELGDNTVTVNYTVPECVGNFCACITEHTNLIKLVNLEFIEGYSYRVYYKSEDENSEVGNYFITDVFYEKHDTGDRFDVPNLMYLKDAFEIPMEYLKYGENYTLIVEYQDSDNINPCIYESQLDFVARFSWENPNDLTVKLVGILLFLMALVMFCVLLARSAFFDKITEGIKKILFPASEQTLIIQNLESAQFSLPHQEVNTLYIPLELSDDPFEFPSQNLFLKDVIGEGAFGKVYYAKAYNINGLPGYTMVAVKLLREGAPKEEVADFKAEITMLKNIGFHKNIVKFLGCVTKNQPYMTIMELVANGDLKEYLLKLREIWTTNKDKESRLFFPDDMEEKSIKMTDPKSESEDIVRFDASMQTPLLQDIGSRPEPVLDHTELENFALQIATGMAYLEKIPVTHRDLAARNILITKEKVLKISDFGMSRSGPYVNRHLKKVPLRWMAIEAIEDFKTDNKSDVWSFGVVLWEIGTLGAFPYEDIPNALIPKALKSGVRLPRPEICTDVLYDLMQRCWMENPNDRPTFGNIVDDLSAKKQNVYVDFKKVNPKYVFPPTDP